jgi:hypothetical protein
MKIKTAELTGEALNWAVETLEIERMRDAGEHIKSWWVEDRQMDPSAYAGDWLMSGPIRDREDISIISKGAAGLIDTELPDVIAISKTGKWSYGPTAIVAALRSFVESKLGEEVDVPDELIAKINRQAVAAPAASRSRPK